VREGRDFAKAVTYQPERQRETQIRSVWPAIEAVYRDNVREGGHLRRPLWWLHTVVLDGCLKLRGEAGCEPAATNFATQEVRNHLLAFPDDPVEAASWRLQRVLIPLAARIAGLGPHKDLSDAVRATLSPEDRIRYRLDPTFFFMLTVRKVVIDLLGGIEPWTENRIDQEAVRARRDLERFPVPPSEWIGPMGDPWLESWQDVDPMLMCGLSVLNDEPAGDNLLNVPELRCVIEEAAASPHELLRRAAAPLLQRLCET